MNTDYFVEVEDMDDINEKDRDREERLKGDKKARDKRKLIRDKRNRRHSEGYGGNV